MGKDQIDIFKNPGHEYRAKPFWSWNGELEEEELKRQVDVMKEMGFGGFFMHSRSGLITEYLGEEWFDLCNKTAEYGKSVGMEPWLYDEDRWPSGSAGGIVTKDPKYRMKSLCIFESDNTDAVENLVSMYEARIDDKEALKEYKKTDVGGAKTLEPEANEKVKIIKLAVVYDKPGSVYNGTTYIDTMMLEATQKFIEVTHEQYKKHADAATWAEIRGIFTDEPHRGKCFGDKKVDKDGNMSCSIFYTDDIFDEFRKRYGYDAKAILPELFYDADDFQDAKALKHDYIDLGCNLFNERFAKPINEWCINNGIDFTGHVLHEDSLVCQTAPNGSLMRFYANMGVPGIDNLCQESNAYWAAKQLQSVCRQEGKKWALSELYGCTGWTFNFKGHKAVGDWQALFGINVRCPHLYWYTMEGAAKRDYPASIGHQASYYKDYSYVEDYFARFGYMMQKGAPVCDVLVINPIESVWMYAHAGWASWIMNKDERVGEIEKRYVDLFNMLQSNNVDFDYVDEQMLMEKAIVNFADDDSVYLQVGEMKYRKVVISGCQTIRSSTLAFLRAFALNGGSVIVLGEKPTMIDEKPAEDAANGFIVTDFTEEQMLKYVKGYLPKTITLTCENKPTIFSQLRYDESDDTFTLALLNVDRANGAKNVKLELKGLDAYKFYEEWDLESGEKYKLDDISTLDFEPCGIHILVLKKTASELSKKPCFSAENVKEAELAGNFEYTLDEKNAVVLDMAKAVFTDNEGKKHDIEGEVLKIDFAIRDILGIEHRSGDSLQPWYIKKYVDETYGKLEMTFTFNVDTIPETEIVLAGERPENIEYYVNGVKLQPDGKFWTDSCLKTMPIPKTALKLGKNEMKTVTDYKRSTNVESAYIVGDFGVSSTLLEKNNASKNFDRGNVYAKDEVTITTLPEKFEASKNTTDQNMLFYSGTITINVTPEMIADSIGTIEEGEKLFIKVPEYVGTLTKVTDKNGNNKKVIAWDPYTADVTEFAKDGFKLSLVCSRKNTFGPLHEFPGVLPVCAPDYFVTGGSDWSDNYVLMDANFGKITMVKSEK